METNRQLPAIPPELHELFIDALHDDKAALSSCALVCRGWVDRSRRRLFHTIRVVEDSDLWLTGDHEAIRTLKAFVKFVTKAQGIERYVRALIVAAHKRYRRIGNQSACRYKLIWISVDISTIAAALRCLPGLRSLVVEQLHFSGLYSADSSDELSSAPFNLDSLTVREPRDSMLRSPTFRLLGIFSVVNTFTVEYAATLGRFDGEETQELLRARKLRVHNLVFKDAGRVDEYWRTIFCHTSSENLRHLAVECSDWDELEQIEDILRDAGSNLLSLELVGSPPWLEFKKFKLVSLSGLDLSVCPSLQSVTFRLLAPLPSLEQDPQSAVCSLFIAYINLLTHASLTLRRIALRLEVWRLDPEFIAAVERLDWAALDRVLERFQELEALSVEIFRDAGHHRGPASSGSHGEEEPICETIQGMLSRHCLNASVSFLRE